MIKEFQAFFTLFQQGKVISNAATWKNRQIAGNALIALLSAALVVAGGFGMTIPVDDATVNAAGSGVAAIVTLVNAVLTVVTSDKVGVKKR